MRTIKLSTGFMLCGALFVGACQKPANGVWQGYAEGEFVLVASPYAGTLDRLATARGQQVAQDAPLFELEHAAEQAAVAEAEARVKAAHARIENLKAGRRADELAALRAQKDSALAARKLSSQQLGQQEQLRARGFVSEAQVDAARAASDRDIARVAEAEAQWRNARTSVGRDPEIDAARAELEAAQAALTQSRWRLDQKSATAPSAALVHDTFFSQGEWVQAGAPIVSLLPPGNIKLRFFVPEALVGAFAPGMAVSASCDGCGAPIAAAISYISPQPEYTPPVIYSSESRAKLVFLVEAKPRTEDATRLKPGQPVDVRLAGGSK